MLLKYHFPARKSIANLSFALAHAASGLSGSTTGQALSAAAGASAHAAFLDF
jgi:hypothetical protein